MTVMERIIGYFKNDQLCREYLSSKDICGLYDRLANLLSGTHQGSTITDILIRCGINPVDYVDGILPPGYRYYNKENDIFDLDPNLGSHPKCIGIGSYAYAYNEGIKHLYIPREIQILEDGCFEFCKGLETVTFQPDSNLVFIGDCCFEGCPNLKRITYLDNMSKWNAIKKGRDCFGHYRDNEDFTIECLDGRVV